MSFGFSVWDADGNVIADVSSYQAALIDSFVADYQEEGSKDYSWAGDVNIRFITSHWTTGDSGDYWRSHSVSLSGSTLSFTRSPAGLDVTGPTRIIVFSGG